MRCATIWPGAIGLYILPAAVGRHGGDKLSDNEEQLQTPRRAGRAPIIRRVRGTPCSPKQQEAL